MVYGSVEPVRREGNDTLKMPPLRGRLRKAGRPRDKDRQIEQDTDRVMSVGDLARFNVAGVPASLCRRHRGAPHKRARQDFDAERHDKDNDGHGPESRAAPKERHRRHFRVVRHDYDIKFVGNKIVKN